jgi:hypothetical protein
MAQKSSDYLMSWFNTLGKMAKGVADFTGVAGLYHDLSTSMSNDDPWYVDSLNVVKDIAKIGTTPVRGAVTGLLAVGQKSYELGGVARQAVEKGILTTPLMYNKFKNTNESYDAYKMRVEENKEEISLGQATLSLLSPGKNSAERSGFFQDWTENNLRFMSAGFDLFDAEDRKAAFSDQYTGKFLSGMNDLVASTVIDPLTFTGFLGKGAVIVSKGTMYDQINGRIAKAVFGKVAMTPEKIDELVAQGVKGEGRAANDLQFLADSDAAEQAGYWAKKKVTNPDAMAFLFGRAKTVEEVGEVFSAITGKNTKAMAALAERDPQTGLVLEKFLDGPSHAERQLLNGALDGDILVSETYNTAINSYVTDLIATDTRYAMAMEKVATGGTQFKYGFEAGLSRGKSVRAARKQSARTFGEPIVETFQKTSLHPVIKVVNYFREDLPSGVFNVNDGNSFQEFNTFLREVNDLSGRTFGSKGRELADNYLTAASEAERMDVIVKAEQTALAHLFPQYSKDEIDKLYSLFDSRRANAIQKHKDQGFISYFVGDSIQHAVAPILNREAANTVIIADMRKLKYAIDAHEGSLKTLLSSIDTQDLALRGQKGLAALDTVNDIFKTSVLMRLGYTVRNLTEAQLSMAAKGFALPGMFLANGREGAIRFFNNRKTGFSRLGDHVNVITGRVDDANVQADGVARYIDALRNTDMTSQQMVKHINQRLGELLDSRKGFTDRLGPMPEKGGQPLRVEDEVRILMGALADLESKVTYHGSPTKFKIDESRPISTSGVKSVADRYSQGGVIASIEQYIPTKTGKPGRLGAKPTPEGETLPTEKRADVLNEAMLKLQADMIDAVNAGKKVEIKKGATWQRVKAIDYETLVLALENDEFETVLFKDWTYRPVFRVGYNEGKTAQIRSYGKTLTLTKKAEKEFAPTTKPGEDLTPGEIVGSWRNLPEELKTEVFANKASNFSTWLKTKGWQDKNDEVTRWATENGYGSLLVSDDKRAAGLTHIILPGSIGSKGREAQVARYIKSLEEGAMPQAMADVAVDFEAANMTPKERRLASRASRKRARSGIRDNAVSPYYLQDGFQAMVNNGIEDAAINIARVKAEDLAALDDAVTRLGARIDVAESNAVKQRIGYGYQEVTAGGHTYTLPKSNQDASWFMGRTSAEQTWNNQVSNQEMAFLTGIGSRSVRLVEPTDPRYFEGWANILNMHFRDPETGVMDAVVRQILDNKSDDEILKWFHTREGQRYANETYTQPGKYFGFHKVSSGEMDEKLIERLGVTRGAVKAYIPDAETEMILSSAKPDGRPLSGGEIQKFLTERFSAQPEKLQPLNGLLVVTSKEYKDQERIVDTVNRRVMRFLGSLPEDVFARHPLAAAMYDKQLKQNIAAIARVKGEEKLTANELTRAVTHARETSRQEVERTLFTIVRRSGASSSRVVKLLFPFYAAYENTLRRWGGMAAENPMIIATAGRTIAQVVNGQTIVDQDGNRITDAKQLQNGSMANLVVQVPQGFIDSLPKSWRGIVQDSFKNINIPLKSLDVITQGEPGNPGIGPFAVLPAYLVLRERPELEDALKVFFPAGMPQKASDLFLPSALRRLSTVWTRDDLYVRSYNQMLRYETYSYNQGKRDTPPTVKEVTDRTNKFFFLRALTAISSPFAIAPEVDFYAQTYRQFQQQYADYRDPITGERVMGMADAKFLEMYPDFFEATISQSKNEGGLEPSIGTVRNLRKFSNLMAQAQSSGDSELLGFLANDGDDQYTFSQAAYQWQYKHGSTPGSGDTYRKNRTANELLIEANVKRGWADFQNLMGQISAYKKQNGITEDNDPDMAIIKEAKALWIDQMKTENLAWYSAYVSPDRAKYERRAQLLETAFKDKKWMAQNGNRAVVKQALVYLDGRKQIAAILNERDAAGGSAMLTAKSNSDIADVYQMFVDELTNGSPEFEQFINRYFANDSVVL